MWWNHFGETELCKYTIWKREYKRKEKKIEKESEHRKSIINCCECARTIEKLNKKL